MYGPTAEDETDERYAACPRCRSRPTHRRAAYTGIWHCHACGNHWSTEGLDPWQLAYGVEGLGDCPTDDYYLWE